MPDVIVNREFILEALFLSLILEKVQRCTKFNIVLIFCFYIWMFTLLYIYCIFEQHATFCNIYKKHSDLLFLNLEYFCSTLLYRKKVVCL